MQANRTPPTMFTLICLTGIATLTLNMFVPSLVNIAAEFDVSYALISVAIAGYMAVTAVVQIVIGPLSDRFGRRPVMLIALAVFCVASLGCLVAADIWVFLMCRLVQGAIIAGAALARVVVRDMFPAKEAASRLGLIAMAMAIAPMLGPMVGGVLDDAFGWRAGFAALSLVGIGLLVLVWFDLGETNANPSATFQAQFRAYPDLLRSKVFWGYSVCMSFATGAFFIFITAVPLIAGTLFEMSSAQLGFFIGTITCGFFFGSFMAARLAARFELLTMVLAGRVIGCLGPLAGMVLFGVGYGGEYVLFGSTVFVGIGNGVTMPSASVAVMSVRADLAGTASGLSGAMLLGVGAALTWLAGIVVTQDASAEVLLGLMLGVTFISLIAALWAGRLSPD